MSITTVSKSLLLSCFAFAASSTFASEPPVCDSQGICTIQRKLKDSSGAMVDVPYKFKYRPAKNGAPTVVVIPGGPGGTSSGENVKETMGLPDDFGVIQTDPLTVGVNKMNDPEKIKPSVTSEQVAADIRSALESTGVKNPIVYGSSYGTVPATILATRLSDSPVGKPHAVVLDGTFGKAQSASEYMQGYTTQIAALEKRLGPETMRAFHTNMNGYIREKAITVKQAYTITQMLLMSPRAEGKEILEMIVLIVAMKPKEGKPIIQELVKDGGQLSDTLSNKFHPWIACRELWPDTVIDIDKTMPKTFDLAELSKKEKSDCGNYVDPSTVSLYDSANYAVTSPIIYLQGDRDPATPKAGAEYHARSQRAASRYMLLSRGGGHGIIGTDLKECSEGFWNGVASNPSVPPSAVRPCLDRTAGAAPAGQTRQGAKPVL